MALKKAHDYELTYTNDRLIFDEVFKNKFKNIENTISTNIHLDDAYVKIGNLTGNKNIIDFTVNIYSDNSKECIIESIGYFFIPDITDTSLNLFRQAYLYLKTLPEFVDAIDC